MVPDGYKSLILDQRFYFWLFDIRFKVGSDSSIGMVCVFGRCFALSMSMDGHTLVTET